MVRTVARNSVEKCPDSGATIITRGCDRRDVLLEMQERAERRLVRRLLMHLDLAIADRDAVDGEWRPRMGEPRARDQLIDGGQIAQCRIVGEQWRTA